MSERPNTDALVKEQYADATNFNARADLHARFGTNPYGWYRWAFDHFELPDGCRILELGCGTGRLWLQNRDRISSGWDITLTDFSAGMLAEAREGLKAVGRKFAFEVADAQAIPFGNEAFDAVIANHMFYHVPDLHRGLREVRRVLMPGGRFYTATNGADHMRELRELVGTLAPDLPFGSTRGSRDFGLEPGGPLLEAHFANVNLYRYQDGLVITEPDRLVDYVLSIPGAADAFTGETLSRLRAAIGQRIATTGSFHVTRRTGLFTADRPESV